MPPFHLQSSSIGGGHMADTKQGGFEVVATDTAEPWSSENQDFPDPQRARADVRWAVPTPLKPGDPSLLSGATITVVDDGQRVASLVALLLESHGATPSVVEAGGIPRASDGIIHLGQLHAPTQVPADLFEDVYPVAKAGATTVMAVTGCLGNQLGEGIANLLGTLAEDLPGANIRAVDLDSSDDPVVLAGRIVAEALATGGPVAVGYCNDQRCTMFSGEEAIVPAGIAEQRPWWGMERATPRVRESELLVIA